MNQWNDGWLFNDVKTHPNSTTFPLQLNTYFVSTIRCAAYTYFGLSRFYITQFQCIMLVLYIYTWRLLAFQISLFIMSSHVSYRYSVSVWMHVVVLSLVSYSDFMGVCWLHVDRLCYNSSNSFNISLITFVCSVNVFVFEQIS